MISRIIIILLLLTSCSPQKKITRLMNNHPDLFSSDTTYIINNDTVDIAVPIIYIDTLVKDADTVYIKDNQVELKIIKEKEYIRLKGQCTPDTIRYSLTDTLTVIQREVVTKTEYKNPQLLKILLTIILLFFLYHWLISKKN